MTLTSRELFLKACQRKKTPRPPLWFMRQAGRYLPEYQELRKDRSFEDLLTTPELAAEITLQPLKRFDLDAAIIFADILTPVYAMRRGLVIIPEKGPVLKYPINDPSAVGELENPNPDTDYPQLGDALDIVRERVRDKALIGFAGAPFTIASYLIEGESTRNALKTKAFALKYPDAYHELLEMITTIVTEQLESEIKHGVDAIQLFDSWAGYLSQNQYEILARPFAEKVLSSKKVRKVPRIYYARGTGHLIKSMGSMSFTHLSIDHTITLEEAYEHLGKEKGLQGNLDPSILLSNQVTVKRETRKILRQGLQIPGYIFNLSQGIDKTTPIANVFTMVEEVKSMGEQS